MFSAKWTNKYGYELHMEYCDEMPSDEKFLIGTCFRGHEPVCVYLDRHDMEEVRDFIVRFKSLEYNRRLKDVVTQDDEQED